MALVFVGQRAVQSACRSLPSLVTCTAVQRRQSCDRSGAGASTADRQGMSQPTSGTSDVSSANGVGKDFKFDESISLERLRQLQDKFAREREWEQFHTPRNLLLAMVGEVGELSELFQWKGEVPCGLPGWSAEEKAALAAELSDVLCYVIRMADRCHIDLPTACVQKIESNSRKYPVDKVRGSSKKYTEYANVNAKSDN